MAGLTRGEKLILALTAGFVLVSGGMFLAERQPQQDYQVTTTQRRQGPAAEQAEETQTAWPDSLLEGERINVNTADVLDLQRLPGIGEKRAQDIVDYREEHGPFESVEDLTQISGIGEGILAGLRDYVSVSDGI